MGVETRITNDRLRTVWTPEMDRYFIDLMLEEVTSGNRIDDNLFSKRAWKHMATLFNARFKSHYEKDVLKNRHKSLRNLYRAVSNLLDQGGFSWDDARQMVTAENSVWDDYIKAHPDARSYRIKTVPYYRDLCLIYGNSSCSGKANASPESPSQPSDTKLVSPDCDILTGESTGSLNDVNIDDDFHVAIPGEDSTSAPPNVTKLSSIGVRSWTYWEPLMDRYFLDLMLDHVKRGNQVDGIFVKSTWTEMVGSFNAKFGFGYEVDILKNRYKTLRRQYNVVRNLLEVDGFSWDESRQMVLADDSVWQDYIKAHSDARQFMTRPVPYYNDLRVIFRGLNNDDRELLPAQNIENTSPRKRVLLDRDMEAKQLKRKGMGDSSLGGGGGVSSISIEDVVEAVQALPDMDDELILDACDFLEDEKRAKTFMALDFKLRRKWLARKLRPELQV